MFKIAKLSSNYIRKHEGLNQGNLFNHKSITYKIVLLENLKISLPISHNQLPKTRLSDNIKDICGLTMVQVERKAQDRVEWRRMVERFTATQSRVYRYRRSVTKEFEAC